MVSVSVYDRFLIIIMIMLCLYTVSFNSRIFQDFGLSVPLWNLIDEEARTKITL